MAVLKLALLAAGASAFVAPTPKTSMMALKADAVIEEEAAPEPAAPAAAPAAAMTFGKMLGDEQFDYSSIVGGARPRPSRPPAPISARIRRARRPGARRAPRDRPPPRATPTRPPPSQPRAAWACRTRSTR